jgi:ribonuclease BN (tRNA processing enzyme)
MEFSLKFVGTGGAFDVAQGNSAAYVQLGDVSILIDCGHTVFPRLVQLGLAHTCTTTTRAVPLRWRIITTTCYNNLA